MASTKKSRRSELPERLATFLNETVKPGQTLVLGLSGGLDSCVLLHLLATARDRHQFQFHAVHVNHGISPNADRWSQFCAGLCAACDVLFTSENVHVPRNSGLGIEAAAREARYRVLLARPEDAVMLAHHRDDQAETLLLQLLRGSGVKGLAAMPRISPISCSPRQTASVPLASEPSDRQVKHILRPLLDIPRSALEAYAEEQGLQWIEDESNLDLAYDRNFLRHHVFPEIEKRFPASRTTLARSASHFAEAAELLDEVAAADAAFHVKDGGLEIAGLRALSAPRGRNLLRYWLSGHLAVPPSTRRLQEAYRQLLDARADAQLRVALDGGELRRYRDRAFFEKNTGAQPLHLAWRGEPEIRLPGGVLTFERLLGQGISSLRVGDRLELRSRTGGERFRPDHRRPTRSLRHLLQEAGMPPWERASLPLIYLGEKLAVVPGIGVACELQATPEEEGWLIGWKRG
jgi:tRNA(Ile)-lysidine synthase